MKNQIPIYVISLNRTPERRLYIQRQLDALGLKYQFVDAVDKYKLEDEVYRGRIARSLDIDEFVLEDKYAVITNQLKKHYKGAAYKYKKNSRLGSLGCALSHIKVYNSIVKNNIVEACILEDDATLLPTFPQVLKAAPKFSWDILLLASQPSVSYSVPIPRVSEIYRIIHLKVKGNRYVLLIKRHILTSLIHRLKLSCSENEDKYVERALYGSGCNPNQEAKFIEYLQAVYNLSSSTQFQIIIGIIRERHTKTVELIHSNISNYSWVYMIPLEQYQINKTTYKLLRDKLNLFYRIKLGAQPEKSTMEKLSCGHYITKPKYKPLSTTAYLIKQAAAARWSIESFKSNFPAIDGIPWQLHKNKQVKLRLITLPCVTATYHYLVYTSRA